MTIAMPSIPEAPCGLTFEEEMRHLICEGHKYTKRIMDLESGDSQLDRERRENCCRVQGYLHGVHLMCLAIGRRNRSEGTTEVV